MFCLSHHAADAKAIIYLGHCVKADTYRRHGT